MKVSVIVPLFNGQKTIKDTLNSILAQTHKELEVFVINDGSTDSSADMVKSLNDPRLNYIHQKNTGQPSGPRNVGIRKSTGDFIAFCDQDDVWYPKKIEKQIASYQKSPAKEKIGIVFTTTDVIDSTGKVINTRTAFSDGYLDQAPAFDRLIGGCIINNCSTLVPRAVIDDIGLLDESLKGNDDYDLWLRITQKYGIYGIGEPLCAWRDTGENLSGVKSSLYLENEKIFTKLLKADPASKAVIGGYGKNINRVLVASILEGKADLAKQYAKKARQNTASIKGKTVAWLYTISPVFATKVLKNADKKGKISL